MSVSGGRGRGALLQQAQREAALSRGLPRAARLTPAHPRLTSSNPAHPRLTLYTGSPRFIRINHHLTLDSPPAAGAAPHVAATPPAAATLACVPPHTRHMSSICAAQMIPGTWADEQRLPAPPAQTAGPRALLVPAPPAPTQHKGRHRHRRHRNSRRVPRATVMKGLALSRVC